MITAARSHIERRLAGSAASALTKGKSSGAPMSARTFWSLSVERPAIRPGRSIVAAIGRRQIFGDETAGVTRRAIDDKVELSLHDVGPPRDPGELSSDPCAIAGHEDGQHKQQVHFAGRPLR